MAIFGWIATVVICVGVVLALALALTWSVRETYDRLTQAARMHERRRIGTEVVNGAYWFSESPEVMAALDRVGVELRDREIVSMNAARDSWRRWKQTQPVKHTPTPTEYLRNAYEAHEVLHLDEVISCALCGADISMGGKHQTFCPMPKVKLYLDSVGAEA